MQEGGEDRPRVVTGGRSSAREREKRFSYREEKEKREKRWG